MFLVKFTLFSYKPKQLFKCVKYNRSFLKKKFQKKILFIKQISPKIKNKIFVVLRSPHINKKSKEHFRYIVYKKYLFYKIKNIIILFNFIIFFIKIFKIQKILVNTTIKSVYNLNWIEY